MENQPLVSVIITTYNRKTLVLRAIEGVRSQNYKNIEIIVVDDHSTDGTEDLFREQKLGGIRYIRHNENLGVQFASNTGFKVSNGEYLAFIGDDDVWSDPEKLTRQVEEFQNDTDGKLGIVTTSVRVFRENEEFDKIIKPPKNLVKHILKHNGIIYGSAALIRRKAFLEAGCFIESLPKGTDSDVFRRIILLGYDVMFLSKPMVDYYENIADRMTLLSEKGVIRSIKTIMHILTYYNAILSCYPSIKAYRIFQLALYYQELAYIKKERNLLKLSSKLFYKSWLTNPLDHKPIINGIKCLLKKYKI